MHASHVRFCDFILLTVCFSVNSDRDNLNLVALSKYCPFFQEGKIEFN